MRVPWLVALAVLAAAPAMAQQSQPPAASATGAGSGETAAAQSAGQSAGQPAAAAEESAAPSEPSGPLEFRTVLGDKPIEIDAGKVTPAFEEFRETGANPFAGDEAALVEGKKIYARLCQACHLPDGSGRIGPSLRDDQWRHPRLETQGGRFEIIHSGGAGAMQAFHPRMSLDEILKVMAWIDTFREG